MIRRSAHTPVAARRAAVLALDHLLLGCSIVGRDWTYTYVNLAAAQHARTTIAQLLGRTIFDAHPGVEHQTTLITALRLAMYDRTSHVLEHQCTFADESTRWFSVRIEPVPEGIRIYSLDIQYRKDTEAALEARVATSRWSEFWRRLWRRAPAAPQDRRLTT